jgi:anti-anti-sigma factor
MSEPVAFEGFIAHQDGCVVVVVRGEIDLACSPALQAVIDEALAASPHVVFDMADVTFLDSTGLRAMVLAAKQVDGTGSITIRNPPRIVSRVLRLSGLTEILATEA